MNIKTEFVDMANEEVVSREKVLDYDFFNDDIVERDRLINPIIMIGGLLGSVKGFSRVQSTLRMVFII